MNYPCPYCTYFTIREWSLDKHVRKMHPGKTWPLSSAVQAKPEVKTAQAIETVLMSVEPVATVAGTLTPSTDTETKNDLE